MWQSFEKCCPVLSLTLEHDKETPELSGMVMTGLCPGKSSQLVGTSLMNHLLKVNATAAPCF